MACGTYPDQPIKYWFDFRFVDGAVCTFGDAIGVGLTMLVFFGVTFLVLYHASGSVMVPTAVVIVLAPVLMTLLPALGVQFLVVVIVLSIAAAGMYAYMAAGGRRV